MEAAILDSVSHPICVIEKLTGKLNYTNKAFDKHIIPRIGTSELKFQEDIIHSELKDEVTAKFVSASNDGEPVDLGILKTLCLIGPEKCE